MSLYHDNVKICTSFCVNTILLMSRGNYGNSCGEKLLVMLLSDMSSVLLTMLSVLAPCAVCVLANCYCDVVRRSFDAASLT